MGTTTQDTPFTRMSETYVQRLSEKVSVTLLYTRNHPKDPQSTLASRITSLSMKGTGG